MWVDWNSTLRRPPLLAHAPLTLWVAAIALMSVGAVARDMGKEVLCLFRGGPLNLVSRPRAEDLKDAASSKSCMFV